MGLTQAAFAEQIGWTKTRLNKLIKGMRGITDESALDLSDVLATSAKLWMNLQITYDLDKAEKARQAAWHQTTYCLRNFRVIGEVRKGERPRGCSRPACLNFRLFCKLERVVNLDVQEAHCAFQR